MHATGLCALTILARVALQGVIIPITFSGGSDVVVTTILLLSGGHVLGARVQPAQQEHVLQLSDSARCWRCLKNAGTSLKLEESYQGANLAPDSLVCSCCGCAACVSLNWKRVEGFS